MEICTVGNLSNVCQCGHPSLLTILYIRKGKGRLRVGDNICQVNAEEAFVLSAGELGEKVGSWSETEGIFLEIETRDVIPTADGFLYPDGKGKKQLAQIADGKKVDANVLLLHLKPGREEKKLPESIKTYVEKNMHAPLSATLAAEEVGVSTRKLGLICKEAFGMGFAAYVSCVRMERAKHLLKNKTVSVSEIAKRLGFSSITYFSLAFKKETGFSPSDYRKYM